MSRVRKTALTAVVAAAAVVASGPALGTAARARLALISRDPVALRGSGFVARERVTVTVTSGVKVVRRLRTGALGGFVVRFVDVPLDPCQGFYGRAVGASGRAATLTLKPPPSCPPPPQDPTR